MRDPESPDNEMTDILILGGGFGGVWAAVSAARYIATHKHDSGHVPSVTLVSPNTELTIRPRLYEEEPDRMVVPLARVLGPVNVNYVSGTAHSIESAAHRVQIIDNSGTPKTLRYGQLVVATGSHLVTPRSLSGEEYAFAVDTRYEAGRLDSHIRTLAGQAATDSQYCAVVVGGGFVGLEVATELVRRLHTVADPDGRGADVHITIVDRSPNAGGGLGHEAQDPITDALSSLQIETRTEVEIEAITAHTVRLTSGESIPADTVIWATGMKANIPAGLAHIPRDPLGRLSVDDFLEVPGVPDVFAAGDTASARAEDGHLVMQSCQHAMPLGAFAGYNAAASLYHEELHPFRPDSYVTCLDLGSWGALYTVGFERHLTVWGRAGKQKKHAAIDSIYPAVDDPHKIFDIPEVRSAHGLDYVNAAR